jgi:hypothetical protein
LTSIQSATQEIREKREKLKEEAEMDKQSGVPSVYLEPDFLSATATGNGEDGTANNKNGSNNLQPSHPHPPSSLQMVMHPS